MNEQPPASRINHLPIPEKFKPVLIEVASYVLTHPDQFDEAAEGIDADMQKLAVQDDDDEADGYPAPHPIQCLDTLFDRAARAGCDLADYVSWSRRMMLLATLATYPCDLSRFGKCGAIPWASKFEGDLTFTPGRDFIVFDFDQSEAGSLVMHGDMQDRSGESVEQRYGELIAGKRENVIVRTPWHVRGLLGQMVDHLEKIMAELRRPQMEGGKSFQRNDPGGAESVRPTDENSLRNSDLSGAEAPAKAASCIVLSEADLKILKTLDASNVLLKGPDAYVDVTERTGKQALKRLENAGLIARPHGERSGYVITDTGRDRLSGNN